MPIIAALLGAIMTGVFYWIIFGNGREAINQWLDQRNEKAKQERDSTSALRARALEARAPLKALTDPRDAASALMAAVAEARGEMTPEQGEVIKARMRAVLGFSDDIDNRLAIALHAARRAGSADVVLNEGVPFFRDALNMAERQELVEMMSAVAAVHGGPTDSQERLIRKLESQMVVDSRPGPA